MKNTYTILISLFAMAAFSQTPEIETGIIAEAEMKSASGLTNMVVNPNTANYDITYHKLEFAVNPENPVPQISGVVTTTFTALADMPTVTFDLTQQLTVSSVTKDNAALVFTQNTNDELVIALPAVQASGTSATVKITYSGTPSNEQQAFIRTTHQDVPIIWTLSEPYGARDWWPCKQDLTDKADTIDVFITAPSQFVSVSNGVEQSQVINGANKTTHFQHGYPIPAYLIAIAVTNYQIYTQQAGTAPNQFPIVNYIYPENYDDAIPQVAVTLPIMDLFESRFETYPYSDEKYGHAQFGYGGGMEHTTVSFMANFGRNLIAHELAHQWFGDKVTCGSWQDIWLNEGFATYLSGMVVEHLDGPEAFVAWKNGQIDWVTSAPGGAVYLTEAETADVNRIFSSRLSYSKGGMVLEMLRWKLGDTAFFQGVRNYLADPELAYDFATTPDLQTHLESASGIDLDEFFNDWVYMQGYPTYNVTAQNIAPGTARITVGQTQSHFSVSFFEMPVQIRLIGSAGQQFDVIVNNNTDNQVLDIAVPFAVSNVIFDPNRHLLSRNNQVSLGSAGFARNTDIKTYPNPAETVLQIDLPHGLTFEHAVIYNTLGQTVMRSVRPTIDVSTLSAGVHFISISTSEGTAHKKFVKR